MYTLVVTLVIAVWLFLSGAIVFAVFMPKWFRTHFGTIIRNDKDLPIWAVAVEKLLQGLGLTLLVQASSQSVTRLFSIPLLLVSGTYLFSTYANYRVKGRPVIVIALIDALRVYIGIVIAGALLGHALI